MIIQRGGEYKTYGDTQHPQVLKHLQVLKHPSGLWDVVELVCTAQKSSVCVIVCYSEQKEKKVGLQHRPTYKKLLELPAQNTRSSLYAHKNTRHRKDHKRKKFLCSDCHSYDTKCEPSGAITPGIKHTMSDECIHHKKPLDERAVEVHTTLTQKNNNISKCSRNTGVTWSTALVCVKYEPLCSG